MDDTLQEKANVIDRSRNAAIPDSKLARAITEYIRDTETELLFNHSSRVYHFGALAGVHRGLAFDPRAALRRRNVSRHRPHAQPLQPTTSASKSMARMPRVTSCGVTALAEEDIYTVWTAIALHTTPGVPQHMHPVVALVTAGVEMDVLGLTYDQYSDAEREAVVKAFPRNAEIQGRHHPGLLRRHQAPARYHLRQCQSRCHRRQGTAFPSRQLLQRHPVLAVARLNYPPTLDLLAGRNGVRAACLPQKDSDHDGKKPFLTHATGAPVADNLNILTAGRRGPALLQDIWLIEKLAHFDREVIPERRMHAKGCRRLRHLHRDPRHHPLHQGQDLFSEIGKQTPMFVRFSTVAGERGAADAERDIRGFAVKFYTEEGNWDIVGNNTPVFFFRDPLRFPDLNHAVKRDPRTGTALSRQQLGFLDAAARGAAPGHHRHERPRHSEELSGTCTASAATPSA